MVAKSSGEAELYGIVRGACEGLGLSTLFKDLGCDVKVRVHIDASAAKGMVERRGLSKVRHLDVDVLWLQEQQARRLLPLEKIPGTDNPADLMTKHVSGKDVEKYMKTLNIDFEGGRAKSAVQLHVLQNTGRAGDFWEERGRGGVWRRRHQTWRRALLRP